MIEHRHEDAAPSCSVCDCLASWWPVIYTWPTGAKSLTKPTQFDVEMPICDKHRMDLKVTDFLCEEIWTGIIDWAFKNNHPIPDRMTAEVRFKRINHEVMVH